MAAPWRADTLYAVVQAAPRADDAAPAPHQRSQAEERHAEALPLPHGEPPAAQAARCLALRQKSITMQT